MTDIKKDSQKELNILITGASGFIGQNLVPKLLQLGHRVRTFGRSKTVPNSLNNLKIEHYCCDITKADQIYPALDNIDLVYHLAGMVSYRKRDLAEQYAVNVLGTRNIMQACLDNKIKRVIHTSSVAALGIPKPGEIGTEEIQYNLEGLGLTYCDTKHLAELEVAQFVLQGLPAIILSPGIIFGEGDTHPHHHVIYAAMSKGWMIGVPGGGVPFSDINDVVDAHITCINKGRIGERYSLVSANLTYRDAARIFAQLNNVKEPFFEIPNKILIGMGTWVEKILPLFGMRPFLTRQVTWLSQHKIFFSSAKAASEIDFKQTPFIETIKRTSNYYLSKYK